MGSQRARHDLATSLSFLPSGAAVKTLPARAGRSGDPGSMPGSGRSPGGGNGNPRQYSCLENPVDKGAWQATVCSVQSLSRVRLFATPWTVATRLLCPWDSPGKNTGVGCHFLLQGIFPTQGSNQGLSHCRQTL